MYITYQWIRSRRKTIAIQIDREGQVIVRTPYGITKRQVEEFLDEKKDWLLQTRQRVEKRKTEQIPISEEVRREGIERAKRIFPERTAYFAKRMGVDYGRITIREQKTRWGSCSSKGNLNFNWKLVLLDPELQDYVVVHELAHRREMNHSVAFWKVVEAELPDYRERRRRLKECRI
ncbi:metal-dependent hydrolase [Roseburia sp. CAG:471]|nr:metal-dependent hydrolase [Roseburia sp. CAG:471]